MKICQKCGKELFDQAVICPNCGCAVEEQTQSQPIESGAESAPCTEAPVVHSASKKKRTILWIVIAVLAAALVITAAILIPKYLNQQKADELEESLIGKTFDYTEFMTYSYTSYSYTFKENNECESYSYYSALDSDLDYTWDYQIEYISDDEIILKVGFGEEDDFRSTHEFDIKLNSAGDKVVSFTDRTDSDAVYK